MNSSVGEMKGNKENEREKCPENAANVSRQLQRKSYRAYTRRASARGNMKRDVAFRRIRVIIRADSSVRSRSGEWRRTFGKRVLIGIVGAVSNI